MIFLGYWRTRGRAIIWGYLALTIHGCVLLMRRMVQGPGNLVSVSLPLNGMTYDVSVSSRMVIEHLV